MTSYKMPAGTYYIGDLCYVLHEAWDEVCELIIKDNDVLEGVFTLKDGRKFATLNTAYGDGEYPVYGHSKPASLGVDAGNIGCILWDSIVSNEENEPDRLGIKVYFEEDFTVEDLGGTLSFGHIEVPTGEDDEDEVDRWADEDCGDDLCDECFPEDNDD